MRKLVTGLEFRRGVFGVGEGWGGEEGGREVGKKEGRRTEEGGRRREGGEERREGVIVQSEQLCGGFRGFNTFTAHVIPRPLADAPQAGSPAALPVELLKENHHHPQVFIPK